MPEPLTIEQSELLEYCRANARGNRLPTFRTVCEALGLKSTGTVSARYATLHRKGYIRRLPRRKWVLVDGVYSADELLREVHESGAELPNGLHERICNYFGVKS